MDAIGVMQWTLAILGIEFGVFVTLWLVFETVKYGRRSLAEGKAPGRCPDCDYYEEIAGV